MTSRTLPGRHVEDVPYTGLVESLTAINLICVTAGKAREHLSSDDLMRLIASIADETAKALLFSGAAAAELKAVSDYMIAGVSISRERPN